MPRVAVVGGGIVGLSCAYFLARDGADVVVLERGHFGQGASKGNAGLISPSLVAPIPGPSALRHALRSLRDRHGTVALRPTASPARLLWLASFARNCTAGRQRTGQHVTARLAQRALASYDALAHDGVSFDMHEATLVFAFGAEAPALGLGAELAELGAYGYPPPRLLDGAALRAIEPALSGHVRAGYVVAGERYVDPASVTRGLVRSLGAMGVELREETPVTLIETTSRRLRVTAARQAFDADDVVIAAGLDSGPLAAHLGVRVRLAGGKGHSVSVAPARMPRNPLGLMDPHIACTPMNGRLRLTGGMELGGVDGGVDGRVLDGILRGAAPFFEGGLEPSSAEEPWSGMRPMAPNGLPVIGPVRGCPGVYLATGHSTLGVTLGPATGELLAAQILRGHTDPALLPFMPW